MTSTGPLGLRPIKQEEFAELDYQEMRVAFEWQNELGRQTIPLVSLTR